MTEDAKPIVAVWLKIDGQKVLGDLQEACETLHNADGEVLLDFSAVRRLDPEAIAAMEELAERADESGVRLVLRGISAEVYKVLKLVKVAHHFSFVS